MKTWVTLGEYRWGTYGRELTETIIFQVKSLPDDCNQNVNRYSYPDLGLHSTDRVAEKRLDPEILLDPVDD